MKSAYVIQRESNLFEAWFAEFGKPGRALCAELRNKWGVHLDDMWSIFEACKTMPPSATLRGWAFGCLKRLPERRSDGVWV